MPNLKSKHTCNGGKGPKWGRKTPGCPRCDELLEDAVLPPHTCNDGKGPIFGSVTQGCTRCDLLRKGGPMVVFNKRDEWWRR